MTVGVAPATARCRGAGHGPRLPARGVLDIPVLHDDQHGTAIISGAALLNALEVAGKDIAEVRMTVSGAGAAAIACSEFFITLGRRRENVTLVDTKEYGLPAVVGTLDATHRLVDGDLVTVDGTRGLVLDADSVRIPRAPSPQ